MTSFDVFVKGIQPERQHEAEHIQHKLSHFLKITPPELTALWRKNNGVVCIRNNISSEEAQKIQTMLTKGGLISFYKPAANTIGLSLSLVEEKPREFICPKCQHKTTLQSDAPDPKRCNKCFIYIPDYLAERKLQDEKNTIRRRLLNDKKSQRQRDNSEKEAADERKRLADLEEQIRLELFGKKRRKLIISSSAVGVLVVASIVGYIYRLEFMDAKACMVASKNSVNAHSYNTSGGFTDGQLALKDTHDKTNKVLGSFGLDADNFANNTSGSKLVSIAPSTPKHNTTTKATPDTATQSDNLTYSLLHDGNNTQEWDLFLNQQVLRLVGRNSLADAYAATQYMIDTEDYINTMTQLLASAQQGKQSKLMNQIATAIESRISTLPLPDQVDYLAQAGYYQQRITQKNDLFMRASEVWNQLANPDEQLKSALKIASYNFKAGNTDIANHYFQQIDNLLAKNESADAQVSARAAIARAYFDVNDITNANLWLASAEPLIAQTSTLPLKELIGSHAYISSSQTTTILKNLTPEKHAEFLYHAIQVALKNNAINTATTIKNSLQHPTYQALANNLIASYDPSIANYSLDYAEKLLPSITLPADKAIVAGRLSVHYSRLGNSQKVAELNTSTEQHIASLTASNAKDDILALIAKNYAHALQFNTSNNLIAAIESETTKSSLQNDINPLLRVKALLN
jgi:hypothetical protein